MGSRGDNVVSSLGLKIITEEMQFITKVVPLVDLGSPIKG